MQEGPGRTDLGMVMALPWISQRRTTWAADLSYALPISVRAGWGGVGEQVVLASVKPPQDGCWTPCSRMRSWSAGRWK
ncbi:hypothetical protein ACZ91_46300 [Streptomyces regensis]|nr:hypothetical protein ACZ91_46300 [Streptomyces regensis]KOG63423.1 hypothetical protein ADK77_23915 [Streptomyces antibioticus]